jgi:GNAT superfamily N-acetyltransferase
VSFNLAAPVPLLATHDTLAFDSGVQSLDDWLRRTAIRNQLSGASRTFVVEDDSRVVAYYALASSAIASGAATGKFRRNMPDPVPVVVLGRLAIDKAFQGKGIGRALFQDAAQRVISAADSVGIRGMIVHALSQEARAFYLRLGLVPSPLDEMTLMVTLVDLRATAEAT